MLVIKVKTGSKGFTLLEVLIAIVITALVGLGSWQLLNSAIRTNELTQARLAELNQLQNAMFFVARDIQQLVARGVRDEYGDLLPAVSTKNEFYALEFTRAGWRNPLGDVRSELQRVAYELDQEGWLVRHYWQMLDRAQDAQPRSRKLLPKVEAISFAFMTEEGSWVDEWPMSVDEEQADPFLAYNQMPRALRLELKHPAFGSITRVFEIAAYLAHTEITVAGEGDAGVSDEEVEDSGENGSGGGTPNVGSESAEETR